MVKKLPASKILKTVYKNKENSRANGIKKMLEKWIGRKVNQKRMSAINKYYKKGKILDIGCGGGGFLLSLSAKWDKYGVDPYAVCRSSAVSFFNKELWDCNFDKGYFDVVCLWHSLEHLSDPVRVITEIKRLLKPGGLLILSTPNTNSLGSILWQTRWFHLDFPSHLFLFNRKTLEILLSDFKIKKISHPCLEYPFSMARTLININKTHIFLSFFAVLFQFLSALMKRGETIQIEALNE